MWQTMIGKLRRWVVGDLDQIVERLRGEVDGLRRALNDPATLQPLVAAALRGEVRSSPREIAAALAPVVDELLEQRELARRARHPIRWLWPAAAAALLAVATAGLWSRTTAVSEATVAGAGTASLPAPRAFVAEQRAGGFGLGGAGMSDEELGRQVVARLGACPGLAGATLSFSVNDGWVWLRGEATAEAREAAERALADLGGGVFVVNQLTVPASAEGAGEG